MYTPKDNGYDAIRCNNQGADTEITITTNKQAKQLFKGPEAVANAHQMQLLAEYLNQQNNQTSE